MAPILIRDRDDSIHVVPVIQAIFEQLFSAGVRDFFIVVGRGKNAIENQFTLDQGFIELLNKSGKDAKSLVEFYDKLDASNIVFLIQPRPAGFGDAVLRANNFIEGTCLVHAGDAYIVSAHNDHLRRMVEAHRKFHAAATLLVQNVEDPRLFGVVRGEEVARGVLRIEEIVEKPARPFSNVAVNPIYIFDREIFIALSEGRPGRGGELQLTDSIQSLVSQGKEVLGVKMKRNEKRLDVGSPETWVESLKSTYSSYWSRRR